MINISYLITKSGKSQTMTKSSVLHTTLRDLLLEVDLASAVPSSIIVIIIIIIIIILIFLYNKVLAQPSMVAV